MGKRGPKPRHPVIEGESAEDRKRRLWREKAARRQQAQMKYAESLKIEGGMTPATVMAIFHFLDKSATRTAICTGVDVEIIRGWVSSTGRTKERSSDSTVSVMKNYVECLAAFAVLRGSDADLSDITAAMEVANKIIGKPEKVKSPVKLAAARMEEKKAKAAPATPPPAPAPEEKEPEPEEQGHAYWNQIVNQIVADSESRAIRRGPGAYDKGFEPMTRDEAIAKVIAARPEAAPYLSPAPTAVGETDIDKMDDDDATGSVM